MRIVIDGRYISDSFLGIGRYTYNLIRALGRSNTRDELFVLINPKLPNRRFDLGEIAALPGCHLVECNVPRFLPVEMFRLPIMIRSLRPTVFHSPFFIRPYPLPCPCVVSLYDLIPVQSAQGAKDPIGRIVFHVGAKMACRYSSAVITPSESSADAIRTWCPDVTHHLQVIPLAPDPCFRPQPSHQIDRMKQKLGLEGPYVLHVGTHLPHKNLSQLITAWAHLLHSSRSDKPVHQLVLAGHKDPHLTESQGLVTRLDIQSKVCFLFDVDEGDLPALYSGADLFVFPSKMEGYGLPVIEAMACGTPVICSGIPPLKEVAGGAAWIVDPDSTIELADAIDRFLKDPGLQRSFAAKGQARAAKLTWEDTAWETYRVYERIAKG